MKPQRFWILLACCYTVTCLSAAPLSLHPENPRYFQFRGQPAVLITSGEHYGAVLNLDFDYKAYLDELAGSRRVDQHPQRGGGQGRNL